ncbi:right-handed parallel beta-helix repeat-containing protein [Octadecabacter ascidiaceicola]|uniref:Pectate lyase superfamily protein n=1 Tax=Octadecabacter ascidiaceicola TaxID=1655543 RepID=A0A238KRK6_9RHOB|nr:right-handed parallel beta-helix repeat-containing protein [Octadecabacter ascidiaceicola]SMX45435.1 Pectate lyase superfamily protein [Octadecabacter ascidiaceicola]
MNKVITDGLVLMPTPFADGLGVWSSGDGTPGSDTYDQSGNGAFVPADQHFDGCLEFVKTNSVAKLRYMGQTSILPGCYLRVTARVKCLSGALPDVRIAGWAGQSGGSHLGGVVETGPSVSLTGYGDVVEISAIIGTGQRTGVDMVWAEADYGHIGLDFTGPNGGVVRVDDIEIEDITGAFLRDMLGVVDVRDYGAVGDGVTDDSAAFEAADNDADGREVLITKGTYFLGDSVTFVNQVRFEGTVEMAEEHRLVFQKNFDYATYVDAFGNEELAFKKAYQALLNFSDHESLDLCGRRITVTAPIDMQAAVNNRTQFETRRVIHNGQFQAEPGPAWDDEVVLAQATYSAADPKELRNVANIASIQVGSLVTGNGVGREVYVREVDVAGSIITLSQELFDAEGTQQFTFTRFKYILDFSGFTKHSDMILDRVELRCNGECSALLIAPFGNLFQVNDCQFIRPKDRAISSIGAGCQGMIIDRCNFESDESGTPSHLRKSQCFNTNANDVKVRNCRASHFRHFAVMHGGQSIIANNHFFNGDDEPDGVRVAGLVLTKPNCSSTISGNYIDNCFVEWTNEHDSEPDVPGYSFGGLTISGNIFLSIDGQPSTRWIVVKPYGTDQFINGLNVQGNIFRTYHGSIERVEAVDTTYADLLYGRMRNILFEGNAFHGIDQPTRNPHINVHEQESVDSTWVVDTENYLPFGGRARTIDALVPLKAIKNGSNSNVFAQPYAVPEKGANDDEFYIVWPEPVKGEIRYSVRMDNPA